MLQNRLDVTGMEVGGDGRNSRGGSIVVIALYKREIYKIVRILVKFRLPFPRSSEVQISKAQKCLVNHQFASLRCYH